MSNVSDLIAELRLRRTEEWRRFIASTAYMNAQALKLGTERDGTEEWKNLYLRFEANVVKPLEDKYQKLKGEISHDSSNKDI